MADDVPPASYLLVVLGGVSYLALMVNWFALPAFLGPVTADLGLTGTQAGVLVGAVPLMYIPLSLFTGLALDRVGARKGIAAAVIVFGTANVLRSTAGGFPEILAATLLIGVGATGITFGLPKLVSEIFPPRLLGSMSTVYILGSYAGVAAAYSVGRGILGPRLGGWRPTFGALGLGALAFAAVWIVVAWWYGRTYGTRYGTGATATFTLSSFRSDVARVFSHRGMRLLVVIGTTYLLLQHGMQGWIPTVLESRGVAVDTAAVVASMFVVGQATGTVVVPPISDRLGRRRVAVAFCGGVAAVGAAIFTFAGTVALATVAVFAVGAGIGGVSPLLRAIPTELEEIGPELTATAVSLIFAVGEIGGFVGPFLVGSLRDVTGSFVPGLTLLAVGGAVMLLAGTRLPEV